MTSLPGDVDFLPKESLALFRTHLSSNLDLFMQANLKPAMLETASSPFPSLRSCASYTPWNTERNTKTSTLRSGFSPIHLDLVAVASEAPLFINSASTAWRKATETACPNLGTSTGGTPGDAQNCVVHPRRAC
jgi:hypothetical protein